MSIFINLEDVITEFHWNARYFDSVDGAAQCVRTTTIRADNADDAEKIAKAQMGLCERVEVMRAATTGPSRVIYALKEAVRKVRPSSKPPFVSTFVSPTGSPLVR